MKKSLSILLVLAMLFTLFLAACNESTDASSTAPAASTSTATTTTDEPAAEPVNEAAEAIYAKYPFLPRSGLENLEPITITRFNDAAAVQWSDENPFIVAMETLTNTHLEMEFLVGDIYEKIGVMVASGDIPDVVQIGVGELPTFIDAGLFAPLQDKIEEFAPNYRTLFDAYWPYMFKSDGNVYIVSVNDVPTGTPNPISYNGCAFYLQKAVLDFHGRAPATVDEYFQFIREYKDANPTIDGAPTIGFESQMNDWRVWSLMHPSKFLQGYGNWGDFGVADVATNKVVNPYLEPYYRTYLEKLNQEFHLGTILAETFTRDHDGYLAAISSGAVLGMFDQEWNFQTAQELLLSEQRYERTYLPIGLTYDESITPAYIEKGNFGAGNGFGISVNSDHIDRILMTVNYLLQEDVQKFLGWGVEGENYTVENGRMVRTPEQRVADLDPQVARDTMGYTYKGWWPNMNGTFSDGNATGAATQNEEAWVSLSDYDKTLFTKLGIENRIAFLGDPVPVPAYYPFWSKRTFTDTDGSAASAGWTNSGNYLKEQLPKLVTAPEGQFDAMYTEFLEGYKQIDVSATMEALQKDIDDILALAAAQN